MIITLYNCYTNLYCFVYQDEPQAEVGPGEREQGQQVAFSGESMFRCACGEEPGPITFQRSDDEEEEQRGEEERCGEVAENVGERPNEEE
jgi:hypothetical protein